MMKKSKMILYGTTTLALITAMPSFSFAEPITWGDDFVQYSAPSTGQCESWHDFLNKLEPAQEYVAVTMSGTFAPEGISITDPAVAQELAYLLYSRVAGEVTSDGHTWSVGIGCNLSTCVLSGEGVELRVDQPGGCACDSAGYNIRPDIGNYNWGGVNTGGCQSPDQTMIVEFQLAPEAPAMSPTIMVGECDSGVDNVLLAENYSVNDEILECEANAKNHGLFVKCVSNITNLLKKEGMISGKDKGAIMDCTRK